jgi:hypothetical protein
MDRVSSDGSSIAQHADLLEQVASELKIWFDAFLVSAQEGPALAAAAASRAGRPDPLAAGRNNPSALGTSSGQQEARKRLLILFAQTSFSSKPRS